METTLLSNLTTPTIKPATMVGQTTVYNKPFPLVLEPTSPTSNFILLQEYFIKNHKSILQAASEYGAIMFQGFNIQSPEEWASILYKSGLKEVNYIGGAAVRKIVVGSETRELENIQIVTTNESPSTESIPFHHELAQTPFPPTHICFYSQLKAKIGGSTPLIRSDFVFDFVSAKFPDLAKKFEEGVIYTRQVPEIDDPSSAIGRSWKSMFNVTSREDAEKKMADMHYQHEWILTEEGTYDCKVVSKVLPAVRVSTNGRKAFHNQVLAAYTGWIDSRNKYGQAVRFSDGSEIAADFIKSLEKFMNENASVYEWDQGKFVIIDNSVTYHSRQPFTGRRRVLAAIADGIKEIDFDQVALTLTSGDKMPAKGLGLWKIPNKDTADLVSEALKVGYRLLDSASDYGNEVEAGLGLKKAIDEGICKRKDVFVTSKLWNTYHRKEHVRPACVRTLKDLGLEYLDLYLVHFPIALKYVDFEKRYPAGWSHYDNDSEPEMYEDNVPFSETWGAMEELVKEGLVRNIGVCNMGVSMLRDLMNYAKVKPSVLQVEMHPFNTQDKLLLFCRMNGIAMTAFSNLGAGSYVELGMASVEESCLKEECVGWIAKKHGVTEGQVVLRWAVQRGTGIIPKTSRKERLRENFNLEFELNAEEMKKISELDKGRRYNDPGVFCKSAFNTFFPIYE